MDRTKRKRTSYKLADAKMHVNQWKLSGMSIREYCQDKEFQHSTLSRWIGYETSKAWGEYQDNSMKRRDGKYPEVEKGLKIAIDVQNSLIGKHGVALSCDILKKRAIELHDNHYDDDFSGSPGWFARFLKRNRYAGVKLSGEAGELSPEEIKIKRDTFRNILAAAMEEGVIPVERIYNADQTALYYRKLPCKTYCSAEKRKDLRGVKQMKDKERLTLMVCTSAAGKLLRNLILFVIR